MLDVSRADRVEVTLDGKGLPAPAVRSAPRELQDDPSDVDENGWLVWSLSPEEAARGPHEIQMRLRKRTPGVRTPITVRHVEIHLLYKSS